MGGLFYKLELFSVVSLGVKTYDESELPEMDDDCFLRSVGSYAEL